MSSARRVEPGKPVIDRTDLSIVMQGGLSAGTMVEIANHCRHWRTLFPAAELILSLSGTDVVAGELQDGLLSDIRLARRVADDTLMAGALQAIVEACDKVALRTDGLPLPPIKSDSPKINNINLQIGAAKNGLRHASRTHVLRVRSDLLFTDDCFIAQYEELAALPRGRSAALADRVMISWLYTLDPYGTERLPLHFSDWFHFGRLEDVRALWDVPFVDLADAIYYLTHPHPRGSNEAERLFNIRIAVEQHVALHALRKFEPDLVLDHHNDHTSLKLAMDLLVDNFCLCDLVAAKTVFGKYQFEFSNPAKRLHCITPEDWRAMVENRGVDYRITLAHKAREAADRRSFELDQGFPRTYEASRLFTKNGRLINREIVASSPTGTLVFGPHVSMPAGKYRATVDATTLEGPGVVTLRATLGHGATVLAESQIGVWSGPVPELALDFDIAHSAANDFEVVIEINNIRSAAIASVTIAERAEAVTAQPFPHHLPAASPDTDAATRAPGDKVDADGRWWRTIASTEALRPGCYQAALNIRTAAGAGQILIRATSPGGSPVLAEQRVEITDSVEPEASVTLQVDTVDGRGVEIACHADGLSQLDIASVTIIRSSPDPQQEAGRRFFPASRFQTRIGQFRSGQIVAKASSGALLYGPYTSMPPGDYTATILLSRFLGIGKLSMAVTADVGKKLLAQKSVRLWGARESHPTVRFTVESPGASELEIVCKTSGWHEIAVAGVVIEKVDDQGSADAMEPRRGSTRAA